MILVLGALSIEQKPFASLSCMSCVAMRDIRLLIAKIACQMLVPQRLIAEPKELLLKYKTPDESILSELSTVYGIGIEDLTLPDQGLCNSKYPR